MIDEATLVPGMDAPDAPAPLDEELDDAAKAEIAREFTHPGDKPKIRKPADGVVDLIWGLEYDGERYRTAMVRELVGRDEEVLSSLDVDRPDYFALLVNAVTKRAVLSIGNIDMSEPGNAGLLDDLLAGDRNLLFFRIMLATYGDTRSFEEVACPHCGALQDFDVDLSAAIKIVELPPDAVRPEFLFTDSRNNDYVVRWPLSSDNKAVIDMQMSTPQRNSAFLKRVIESVNGQPVTMSFIEGMNLKDRQLLIRKLGEQPGPTFEEVKVSCPNCDESTGITFGWADLLSV